MGQKVSMKDGYMKFLRLGPIKFGKQNRWEHRNPPASKGMWVFPAPFFEPFLAYHKYSDLAPKRFSGVITRENLASSGTLKYWSFEKDDSPVSSYDEIEWDDETNSSTNAYLNGSWYEEQEEWVNKVGRKILPVREFWYTGIVYSHFRPNGEIGSTGLFGGTAEWFPSDVSTLYENIRKSGGDHLFHRKANGELIRGRTNCDHLEVFIAPHMGKIRG